MPWLSLSAEVDAAHAEAFSDALLEAGAISVSIEDADAGTVRERPLYGEPSWESGSAWNRNRVHALAAQDCDAAALIGAASIAAGILPPQFTQAQVEEQDWVRATQAQFAPVQAGEHLWIVPSWHAPPQDPAAVVVRLDPGLAFGTGSHPTTRLVLGWLERIGCAGLRVLDYGCGSGILAIAAARLGAAHVDGVDIDPQALVAAASNAADNGVTLRACTPDTLAPGQYDIVLANILANPLITLAPEIASRTRPGARIALSGILGAQAADVIAAYATSCELRVAGSEDGWVLVAGTRR